MPTVLNWPTSGESLLGRPKSPVGRNASGFYAKDDAPFAVLTVYFRTKTGTIREGNNTVPISGVRLVQTAAGPLFTAAYAIGKHSGNFSAVVDCTEAAEALNKASGGKGVVGEYSGASSPASVSDHRMLEIAGEFIDTRPLWWREIFRRSPKARQAINDALPGLAERLESGAVLSAAEHRLYQVGKAAARARAAGAGGGARPTPLRAGGRGGPQPH